MAREWIATVGSGQRVVEIVAVHQDQGRLELVIDGETVIADAVRVHGDTWSVLLGQRSMLVHLPTGNGSSARGQVLSGTAEVAVVLEDARKKRLAELVGTQGEAAGEVIRAPIAGRVVKLLVEVGTQTSAGDSLIVLEAMKMENEIKASRGGTVTEIHVSADQAVDSNQVLITIE